MLLHFLTAVYFLELLIIRQLKPDFLNTLCLVGGVPKTDDFSALLLQRL